MKNLVSVFSIIYYATKFLILVALIQWWLGDAYAAGESREMVEIQESQRELLNILGDGTFSFKETINCTKRESGRDSYYQGRAVTTYYRCPDQTISFPQPDSTGMNGWNGFCGQTAVSNITSMFCGRHLDPKTVDSYATDITPGNLPGTNRKALRKIFTEDGLRNIRRANNCPDNGSWAERSPWTANGYIEGLKEALWRGPGQVKRKRNSGATINISPVAVLIAAGVKTLHWVTLVDFRANNDDKYACDAVVNTWGNQKIITCENLVKYGNTTLFGYRYLAFEN